MTNKGMTKPLKTNNPHEIKWPEIVFRSGENRLFTMSRFMYLLEE